VLVPVALVVIVGARTFVPARTLRPAVEHLQLAGK
jgi:K+-transporting ATPase A subunit